MDNYYGKEASSAYVIGTRNNIENQKPIIGPYNVNKTGGDIYYKGANVLHTLRQLLEDDNKWREILRGLNSQFYHQTVTSKQVEDYLSQHTGIDLTAYFNQYLRTTKIPMLEYKLEAKELKFRYTNIVEDFDMPVLMHLDDKKLWIFPTVEWKTTALQNSVINIKPDVNFYIYSSKI